MKWATKIMSILTGGGDSVLGKIIDKIPNPGDKKRLQAELEMALHEQLSKHENDFRNFVLEYEGRGAEMHWTIQILRASVRPVITYAAFGFLVWIAYVFMNSVDLPEQTIVVFKLVAMLNFLTLAFWFGEKALVRSGLGDGLKTWLKNGSGHG